MDTIVTTQPTIGQIAEVVNLLARHGIGTGQFQRLVDDVDFRSRVVQAWRDDDESQLADLSGQFHELAMKRLVGRVFEREIRSAYYRRRHPGVQLVSGVKREELAKSEVIKALLEGLSPLHTSVAILRAGLRDGVEVSASDVAEQFGLSVNMVSTLRREATNHMVRVAGVRYPAPRYERVRDESQRLKVLAQAEAPEPDKVTLADDIFHLRLTVRAYNLLAREGVRTVGELADKSEEDLLDIRNFGTSVLEEVKGRLAICGLTLRQERS